MILNNEWYNENSMRSYPLLESATQLDNSGTRLPNSFLVDLALTVPAAYATGIRISVLGVTQTLVTIAISSDAGPVCAGTYLKTETEQPLPLIPIADGVAGIVVFGAAIATASPCRYSFSVASQSAVSPTAVTVLPDSGVTGIVRQGNQNQAKGAVRITGGSGTTVNAITGSTLLISLPAEAALKLRQTQASANLCPTPPIRRINGVTADLQGRLLIRFL